MKQRPERKRVFELWIPVLTVILLTIFILGCSNLQVTAASDLPTQDTSKLLSEISIGCGREWMAEQLGTPKFVGATDQYQLCAYVTDTYVVQAAYNYAGSLQAYMITALPGKETIVIDDQTFYPPRDPVFLGEDSYHSYPGAPDQVWGYVSQGNTRAFYAEMYDPASVGNYEAYYLASVDFGRLAGGVENLLGKIQLGLTEIDDEVGKEQINTAQTLVDRKNTAPNSYGVSVGEADFFELFGTYNWWNSQKLRNQNAG